jgi:hypothetical protein
MAAFGGALIGMVSAANAAGGNKPAPKKMDAPAATQTYFKFRTTSPPSLQPIRRMSAAPATVARPAT